MKKLLFGSVVFGLLLNSGAAQNWFKGTLDEAIAKAKSENKKILLDFFSAG